jgi:predicted enzyme related to lactoylglutathione lyase
MDEKIAKLKEFITEKSSNPNFTHHKWFVTWHLEIVERIAEDLLRHYPDADKDIVRAMVWMHDYGKIIDFDSQYSHEHVDTGRTELVKLGFNEDLANTVAKNIKILDAKVNLHTSPIEVQIVSSADGCSHLVGPFIRLYWWQNPQQPYQEIMAENIRKLTGDWDKKVVLPEARRAYQKRHDISIEQSGQLPESLDRGADESVDSVNFYVSNLDKSVAFYADTLGLTLDYRQGDKYASFIIGQVNLGLKKAAADREKPGSQTIILTTHDAHKKYAQALQNGLQIHTELSDVSWGVWFSISDPDGNLIEYLQRK